MRGIQAKIIRKQETNEVAVSIGIVGINNNIVTVITFEEAEDLHRQLSEVINEIKKHVEALQ